MAWRDGETTHRVFRAGKGQINFGEEANEILNETAKTSLKRFLATVV